MNYKWSRLNGGTRSVKTMCVQYVSEVQQIMSDPLRWATPPPVNVRTNWIAPVARADQVWRAQYNDLWVKPCPPDGFKTVLTFGDGESCRVLLLTMTHFALGLLTVGELQSQDGGAMKCRLQTPLRYTDTASELGACYQSLNQSEASITSIPMRKWTAAWATSEDEWGNFVLTQPELLCDMNKDGLTKKNEAPQPDQEDNAPGPCQPKPPKRRRTKKQAFV